MSKIITPAGAPLPAPLPWSGATVIVVVVVLTAATMVLAGYPVSVALGVVGGAGAIGYKVVRRVARILRSTR